MPYRTLRLLNQDGFPETHWVRVDDRAVAEWLPERARLRHRGYPDRPPDVDTLTLRAWLPRPGEAALPYFRACPARSAGTGDALVFPVFTATWHRAGSVTTKVLVTGMGDGSFLSRVVVVESSGACHVDKAKAYSPDVEVNAVWREIEIIIRAINEASMGWEPRDPMVTDYLDFLDLDGEVETAGTEARAAGLLAPEWVQ
jgi:hypothetical protein